MHNSEMWSEETGREIVRRSVHCDYDLRRSTQPPNPSHTERKSVGRRRVSTVHAGTNASGRWWRRVPPRTLDQYFRQQPGRRRLRLFTEQLRLSLQRAAAGIWASAGHFSSSVVVLQPAAVNDK